DAPVAGPRGFYGSENAKLAFERGAFDRSTRVPTVPASASGYPIINADKAFDLIKAQSNGPPAGSLRLTISDVRLGTGTFATDRGSKTMPVWLFSMAEVDGPIAVLAVAPEALWFPPDLGPGQSHDIGASVGRDNRTLTVNFLGAAWGLDSRLQGDTYIYLCRAPARPDDRRDHGVAGRSARSSVRPPRHRQPRPALR